MEFLIFKEKIILQLNDKIDDSLESDQMVSIEKGLNDDIEVEILQETMSKGTLHVAIKDSEIDVKLFASEKQIENLIEKLQSELAH